jgi:hypothetical protein
VPNHAPPLPSGNRVGVAGTDAGDLTVLHALPLQCSAVTVLAPAVHEESQTSLVLSVATEASSWTFTEGMLFLAQPLPLHWYSTSVPLRWPRSARSRLPRAGCWRTCYSVRHTLVVAAWAGVPVAASPIAAVAAAAAVPTQSALRLRIAFIAFLLSHSTHKSRCAARIIIWRDKR